MVMSAPEGSAEPASPSAPHRGTFVAQSSVVSVLPEERLATLSRMEFQVFREGQISTSGRDTCIGVAVSAFIGFASLVGTVDWETIFHEMRKGPILLALLLFGIFAGSTAGAAIFQWRNRATRINSAYSTLLKRLEEHFKG
jgi:hypothetical protein